ncbi:MAG TPA: YciI family protein [Bryobacteraceae bacterium]|jgi:hypothetical protein
MAQYLLLLYQDPKWMQNLSPEEMQKAVEKYTAWMKKSFTKGGQRLSGPGKVMRPGEGKPRVVDGPYSETKEALGGYYLIEAASEEEAVTLTMDHPHLEYGGTIEVRHVFGT